MRRFASGTVTLCVPVCSVFCGGTISHILERNSVSKSYSEAEICFYLFAHLGCVPLYIFAFRIKESDTNWKDFTFLKLTFQLFKLFNNVDEMVKDETPMPQIYHSVAQVVK